MAIELADHEAQYAASNQTLWDKVKSSRGNRIKFGGYTPYVEAPPEFRGASNQVNGLWPFVVGSAAPPIGVPLGPHLINQSTVCMDPISWFEAGIILNPSQIIVANTSTGKSTLIRRQSLGLAGAGVIPLNAGDLKGEHVATTREITRQLDNDKTINGQIIKTGRGRDSINPLASGSLDAAARRLENKHPKEAAQLREEAHGRRVNIMKALISLRRQQPVNETEASVLSRAIAILAQDSRFATHPPLLKDLVELLENPPQELRDATLDRGQMSAYHAATDGLIQSVMGLMDGEFGATFARHTTTPLDLEAPAICVDVSSVDASDQTLKAALLLVTWNDSFATIEANNALADCGAAEQKRVFIVLDELWQVLLAAPELVLYINFLTRLNRHYGVAQAMATHTLADLAAFDTKREREMARGFAERAGAVILGALPEQELLGMSKLVRLRRAEREQITAWSTPRKIKREDQDLNRRRPRPGAGKFLIKAGARAGIPVQVKLTRAELIKDIHNTDGRWG